MPCASRAEAADDAAATAVDDDEDEEEEVAIDGASLNADCSISASRSRRSNSFCFDIHAGRLRSRMCLVGGGGGGGGGEIAFFITPESLSSKQNNAPKQSPHSPSRWRG
jgi:hypothetical protein